LLSWRAGQLTPDQFVEQINSRMDAYFSNPLHTLNNTDAAAAFWKDSRAQTVPYGRGLLYLINTDARIRMATGGKDSVDNTVLWVLASQRAGQTIGVKDWVDHVGAIVGVEIAKADYEAMVSGKIDEPVDGALGPCFAVVPARIHAYDLGFETGSLDAHKIKGLVADSAAAKAGLLEGDTIIETSDTYYAQHSEANHLTIKVKRGDQALSIDYIPRDASAIASFNWRRLPGISDANCKR